jgi:hypothetical protein
LIVFNLNSSKKFNIGGDPSAAPLDRYHNVKKNLVKQNRLVSQKAIGTDAQAPVKPFENVTLAMIIETFEM